MNKITFNDKDEVIYKGFTLDITRKNMQNLFWSGTYKNVEDMILPYLRVKKLEEILNEK